MTSQSLFSLLLLVIYPYAFGFSFQISMEGLAGKYNYTYENHTVSTDDGFIITIGRLPFDPGRCEKKNGTVIVGHGFLNNAEMHMLTPNALAYRLSNACYDVWLTNIRGTRYSSHTNYTHADRLFWDFSHDENGLKDLRSFIDYIRENVGETELFHFVGYSQSNAHMLILLTTNPSYQHYFRSLHMMAPVIFMTSVTNPRIIKSVILSKVSMIPELANRVVAEPYDLLRQVEISLCVEEYKHICPKLLNTECGMDDIMIWAAHFPDRGSLRALGQFLQWKQGEPRRYDWGPTGNKEKYGTYKAPVFDFSTSHVPTYIYHSPSDPFSKPPEVERLVRLLPNVRNVRLVENHGHGDCKINVERGHRREFFSGRDWRFNSLQHIEFAISHNLSKQTSK